MKNEMRTPTLEIPHGTGNGVQKIYRFANGYGASVVRFPGSYGYEKGLWELAVIRFNSEDIYDWRINYKTPITKDVIGYLDNLRVNALLEQIEALP
jgi:hypothetical protein